ncbi:nuclear transport factor 2 family protein [Chryseobacterium salipaludis]|uniref:nuclear transport factor 2 family protein n=1 Tax=Chryseobacterium TaxID=59732 RepID=UPI001FF3D811|nr:MULTISPECIES: nuclear transport factor 2 family protein [Chryseobacterium]MCJ8497000.1 nuclear transport factor 2 family protein [Chryseobacterium salipaludis]MCX3296481.1 nuclear transport factor 2 family protein [Planobacterium sp. JC490]
MNLRRLFVFFFLSVVISSCSVSPTNKSSGAEAVAPVNAVLDDLHRLAAAANFNDYFNLYADESVFIGTDATEVWTKAQFMAYAKPHFDKGRSWSFTPLKRQVTLSNDGTIAWFDEMLDTQMKICRGSGVLEKTKEGWKVRQYVLSMAIPNALSKEVVKLKTPLEEPLIEEMKH